MSQKQVGRSSIYLGKWVRKVRMVNYVERVRAELEANPFREREFPAKREINLCQAEARYIVAPLGALPG